MNTKNERQLIELAKNGNADAFCKLYDAYRQRLYRYAFYRLGNGPDAEDAVSECVLSAWRQIGSLREPDAFTAWIFRILSGCCGRLIQQQIQRRQQASLDGPATGPDAADASSPGTDTGSRSAEAEAAQALTADEADPDTWLTLQTALGELSDTERNIVLFSAVGGLKSHEIAELTGMTAGSVRSSLSRSLKKLRGYLS